MVLSKANSIRYGLMKPKETHRRPATCDEVACKYLRDGWQMHVMEGTPLGDRQRALIERSGRRFMRTPEEGSILYTFEPGQQCFRAHTVGVDRPPLYVVRDGVVGVRRHTNPEHWVEDFSNHLDKIRE